MFKKVIAYLFIFIVVAGVLIVGDRMMRPQSKIAIQTDGPNSTILASSLPEGHQSMKIGSQSLIVEVADTPAKQQQGLSGRTEIGSDGMLFTFFPPIQSRFWMKDMVMDLDFIWIADEKVVEITPAVPRPIPGSADQDLPIYQPAQAVDAMLEVESGFVQAKGIQVGDTVIY